MLLPTAMKTTAKHIDADTAIDIATTATCISAAKKTIIMILFLLFSI